MKMIRIDNRQNIIDSRDVISRIEELEVERDAFQTILTGTLETLADAQDDTSALDEHEIAELKKAVRSAGDDLTNWDTSDDAEELRVLQLLDSEGRDASSEYVHGEPLIRDSYFEEYAQQLAEDTGAISSDLTWPKNCIDWERAAAELQYDYTTVNFDNEIYWIRSI